jgi:hypothetical protein
MNFLTMAIGSQPILAAWWLPKTSAAARHHSGFDDASLTAALQRAAMQPI